MAYFLHAHRENVYVDEVTRELTTMPATTAIAHVIMNRNAGAGDKTALRQEIATAFSAHGWEVEFILVGRRNLHRRVRQVITEGPGALVVAGGDGTINAVAAACLEAKRPLGIMPAGTFNYVARNLRLPTAVSQAVSVIVDGRIRHVDIGELNGRLFLNNAGFGLYGTMVAQREHDKRRFGRHRIVAFLSGLRCLLSVHPLYTVELTADGETRRCLTTTLFFGCNPLQLEHFNITAAECLRQQKLAVLSLRLRNRWEIAKTLGAGLIGRLEQMDTTEAFCASTVRVQLRRQRALRVVMDGEVIFLRPPLDVTLHPGALQVFAPVTEHS
jgi:diacylglycerol kinase family enzyme